MTGAGVAAPRVLYGTVFRPRNVNRRYRPRFDAARVVVAVLGFVGLLSCRVSVAGSLAACDAPDRGRLVGPLRVDNACTFDLDARLPVERSDPQLAGTAPALRTFARAHDEADAGHLQSALDLAEQALGELGPSDAADPVHAATIGAFAVDRAVDQALFARARGVFDRLDAVVARRLDPDQPAALRWRLATIRLEGWPDALPLRQALAPRLARTFGDTAAPTLENRVRLASTLMNLNRAGEAMAEFDAIEAILRADPRPLPALRTLQTRAYANSLSLMGRHDAQIDRLRDLRAQLTALYGIDDRRVVDVDADMARGLADAGRLPAAIAAASKVYLWRDRTLGAAHPRTQEIAQLLALLYGRTGRFATARALLEHLMGTLDPASDVNLLIRARRDLATWMAMDGEPRAALDLMRGAYDTARARYSDASLQTIGIAIDYGWLLLRAGQPDNACALLERVQPLAPPANGLREFADAGLGRCLLMRTGASDADTARALGLLREAAATADTLVGEDNSRALVWQALLAAAELRAGHRAVAKRLLEIFVDRAERNRAALAPGAAGRDATFGLWVAENDSMAGYRTLAWLHAQDGDLDAALRVSELARDRQLRDRFVERRWARGDVDSPAAARLRELQAQRQGLDEQIAVAGIAQRVRLEAERVDVADATARLERAVAARFPEADTALPTLESLRVRLAPDTAMVAYQHAGDQWWALVIDRDRARVVRLPDSPRVAAAARAWARAVRGEPVRVWAQRDATWALAYVRPAEATARVPLDVVEQQLGAALFGALDLSPRTRRLVIVADDDLVGLPLDALAVDTAGTKAVMRYALVYAASFGGWLALQDRAPLRSWPRDLFAVGAIDAPNEAAATPRWSVAATRGGWEPLPYARSELERVAAQFPRPRVRVLIDGAASKDAVRAADRSGELAGYRFVHFATHGHVLPAFAERAALVLSGPDGGVAELTATELAGFTMNAQLVVLSACDSGVGRYEQGQGLLGFAFAALAAGNRGAVLSLWPVADATTEQFMTAFYARLRAGVAPAVALAATKRAFAASSDPARADRRVWSAFVLYGT